MYDNLEMPKNVSQTHGADDVTYFVFAEGGRSPVKQHASRYHAEKEARRLAASLPGRTVHVVKSKSVYVNDLPLPASARPRDERLAENFQRQMAARISMYEGAWVKVRADHHSHPGEIGYITSLGDSGAGDSSVYVRTTLSGDESIRFSPTSLHVQSPATHAKIDALAAAAEGTRDSTETLVEAAVGDILSRTSDKRDFEVTSIIRRDGEVAFYACRDIIDNTRDYEIKPGTFTIKTTAAERGKPDTTKREDVPGGALKGLGPIAAALLGSLARSIIERHTDAEDTAGSLNDPESIEEWDRANNIPVGTDIFVINHVGNFLPVGVAHPAKKVRNDSDKRFIWVKMTGSDGEPTSEEIKVNGSRVFRADDPEKMVLGA